MILCKRCGNQNPLGRVFCTKCGTKLELTHMTAEHVVEIKKRWTDPLVLHWRKLATLVVVVVLILAALAFWPQTALIGTKGTLVDGRRVDIGIKGIGILKPGQQRNMEFTERDINGYFEFIKNKNSKMGVDSISVSLQQEYFVVRIIMPLGSIPIPQYRIELKTSFDLVLVPYGQGVMPKKVFMGHLSLFEPIRAAVVRKIIETFARDNDWTNLKNISEIKALSGKLVVHAKK